MLRSATLTADLRTTTVPPMTLPSIPDDIREALVGPLERLGKRDPVELLTMSNSCAEALLEGGHQIASMRRAAVRQLRIDGFTLREIGDQTNMSVARVHQIESGYDRKEKKERAKK